MKRNPTSDSGLFHPRTLLAFAFCLIGLFLAMFSFARTPSTATEKTSASTQGGSLFRDNRVPVSSGTKSAASLAQSAGPTTNLSNGITFDHATWNDPIRMVGEPDIVIDYNDGIYVSGPGGSTTQASWFWKSTDKGLQWHLIGCPLKSNCQNGGGDTEIAVARNNDVFASDLQTLTCNSALRSYDQGSTWLTSEGCFPGTDRQWMGVYDPNSSATGRRIYLSANGQTQGCYFLVSTDNGVTYVPTDAINNPDASIGGSCIGRFAINPVNGHIYVPGSSNTKVSTDGGVTFLNRPRPTGVADNLFATIVVDTAGNLWWAWINNQNTMAFVSYSTNEGQTWSTPLQVSTGAGSPAGTSPDLHAVIMPWLVAGDPGRVAVVYYGTTNSGTTSVGPGDVNALWHVYASISTNAMDANPIWTQVQADEHPMHRSTICTGGTGCVESQTNGDRSMADFFAVDKDSEGRIYIAYNENSDLSLVVPALNEYIGKPINAAIRLRTGPSLYAAKGNLLPDPSPAKVAITSATVNNGTITVQGTHGLPPGNWASDPAGDAPYPVIPVSSANHPALDIREASVNDDGTNLTVKLTMADLSTAALADAATTGGTPTWMVTWFQAKGGVGPATTSGLPYSHKYVKWLGQTAFQYGTVSSINSAALGAPTPKTLTYVPDGTATGVVSGNDVTITVPLSGFGLVAGDKIDHIIAYSMVEHADVTLNDWADQVKSFSYVIGTSTPEQHGPDGYVQVSLDGFTTSVPATFNNANNTWTASLPSASGGTVCARQILSKDLYTPLWDDVQAGPTSCQNFGPLTFTKVVSRKTHGSAGNFDIDLPLTGPAGVECRAPGPGNTYTLIYTFNGNVTVPGTAIKTQGTAIVGVPAIGPNPDQVTVNVRSVSNAQHLVITLNGVQNSLGETVNNAAARMDSLLGDVDASGRVDSNDVTLVRQQALQNLTTSNFRDDVDVSGRIDSNDATIARQQALTSLP